MHDVVRTATQYSTMNLIKSYPQVKNSDAPELKNNSGYSGSLIVIMILLANLFLPVVSYAEEYEIINDTFTYPKGVLAATHNTGWVASSTVAGGYWPYSNSATATNGGDNWILNLVDSGYYSSAISACATEPQDPCTIRISASHLPNGIPDWNTTPYVEFNVVGGDIEGYGQTETRIYATVPSNNAIKDSTTIQFEVYYYLAQSDIDQLSTGGSIYLHSQAIALDTIPPHLGQTVITFEVPAVSGYGVATSTATLQYDDTNYYLQSSINASNYWNLFGGRNRFLNVSTTTFFTVGSTTEAGAVDVWYNTQISQFRDRPTAYDTVNATCNPFYNALSASSTFDIGLCIYSVVIPPPTILEEDVQRLREQFFSIAPMGYANRVIELIQSTTTVALPTLEVEIPENLPGGGLALNLTPWNYLMGSTSIAGTATTSLGTLRSSVENYWNWIWYILLAFAILHDVTGFGKTHHKMKHA